MKVVREQREQNFARALDGFYGGGSGGDAYLSVSYNVFVFFCFFVSVIRERPYCLNKKSFILVFFVCFKYLFTALLYGPFIARVFFRFCFALLRCARRTAASTRTSFCLVWCAPSVGEHSELCFFGRDFKLRRIHRCRCCFPGQTRSSAAAESPAAAPCGPPAEVPAR